MYKTVLSLALLIALFTACNPDNDNPKPATDPVERGDTVGGDPTINYKGHWLFVKTVSHPGEQVQDSQGHQSYLEITDTTLKQWLNGNLLLSEKYSGIKLTDPDTKVETTILTGDEVSYAVSHRKDTLVLTLMATGAENGSADSYFVRTNLPVPKG